MDIIVWVIGKSHASMIILDMDMKLQHYEWSLKYLKTQLLVVYNKGLE